MGLLKEGGLQLKEFLVVIPGVVVVMTRCPKLTLTYTDSYTGLHLHKFTFTL
jgi:hypothetical protein